MGMATTPNHKAEDLYDWREIQIEPLFRYEPLVLKTYTATRIKKRLFGEDKTIVIVQAYDLDDAWRELKRLGIKNASEYIFEELKESFVK